MQALRATERTVIRAAKRIIFENKMERESGDEQGPAIAITGSVLGGFEFTGPFESVGDAIDWAENHSIDGLIDGLINKKSGITIAKLKAPKYQTNVNRYTD